MRKPQVMIADSRVMPVIREKIGDDFADLFSHDKVDVVNPKRATIDYRQNIQDMPYVFYDPVPFDRKIDPRTMTFGSKIETTGTGKERSFHVKRVITSNTVKRNNDTIVSSIENAR